MNTVKKSIRDAASEVYNARLRLTHFAMMKTERDPEKARKQSEEYSLAKAEYLAACNHLESLTVEYAGLKSAKKC